MSNKYTSAPLLFSFFALGLAAACSETPRKTGLLDARADAGDAVFVVDAQVDAGDPLCAAYLAPAENAVGRRTTSSTEVSCSLIYGNMLSASVVQAIQDKRLERDGGRRVESCAAPEGDWVLAGVCNYPAQSSQWGAFLESIYTYAKPAQQRQTQLQKSFECRQVGGTWSTNYCLDERPIVDAGVLDGNVEPFSAGCEATMGSPATLLCAPLSSGLEVETCLRGGQLVDSCSDENIVGTCRTGGLVFRSYSPVGANCEEQTSLQASSIAVCEQSGGSYSPTELACQSACRMQQEICSDGIDNNCNFRIDEGCAVQCLPVEISPTGSATGTTYMAEDVFPSCGATSEGDALYSFTAPSNGTYGFASSGLTTLSLQTACSPQLMCLAGEPSVREMLAGERMYLVVSGASTRSTSYQVTAELANFSCEAQTLTGTTLSTTGNLLDAGDSFPQAGTSCSAGGRDRLYVWIAPEAGSFDFDTVGTSFDTLISLRTACNASFPALCNDDIAPGNTVSKLTKRVEAGERIYIVVSEYSPSTDNRPFTLRIAPTGSAPADAGPDDAGADDAGADDAGADDAGLDSGEGDAGL